MRVLPLCIFATVTYFMMGRRERERGREGKLIEGEYEKRGGKERERGKKEEGWGERLSDRQNLSSFNYFPRVRFST